MKLYKIIVKRYDLIIPRSSDGNIVKPYKIIVKRHDLTVPRSRDGNIVKLYKRKQTKDII